MKTIRSWARNVILSIALGICSFEQQLRHRDVIIWSDNTGAEHAAAKGTTKSFDHTCLVHALWQNLAEQARVERVPTKDNIADLPSGESYDLLRDVPSESLRSYTSATSRRRHGLT